MSTLTSYREASNGIWKNQHTLGQVVCPLVRIGRNNTDSLITRLTSTSGLYYFVIITTIILLIFFYTLPFLVGTYLVTIVYTINILLIVNLFIWLWHIQTPKICPLTLIHLASPLQFHQHICYLLYKFIMINLYILKCFDIDINVM